MAFWWTSQLHFVLFDSNDKDYWKESNVSMYVSSLFFVCFFILLTIYIKFLNLRRIEKMPFLSSLDIFCPSVIKAALYVPIFFYLRSFFKHQGPIEQLVIVFVIFERCIYNFKVFLYPFFCILKNFICWKCYLLFS